MTVGGGPDGDRYHVLAGSGVEVFLCQLSDTGEKLSRTLVESSEPVGGSCRFYPLSLTSEFQAGCSPRTQLLEMVQKYASVERKGWRTCQY